MKSDELKSPWAEFDEERRAAAIAHREIRQHLRCAFRIAQKEAYELWCVWQAEIGEDAEPEQ